MLNHTVFTEQAKLLEHIRQEQLPTLLQTSDWQSKYRLLMQLSKALSLPDDGLKRDEYQVPGCESQFWLAHFFEPASQKHYWAFESDARIIKGLASILLSELNAKKTEDIHLSDAHQLFDRLKLSQNLSPSRTNGLQAILERIKADIS